MVNLLTFDLNLLRVLDALLEVRSTTKAATRLGLSQPAVSAALGRLRGALNDPLFVREGQGLAPTDFALGLEVPLRDLLEQLVETLSQGHEFDPLEAEHRFRLSGSDFFAELLMPKLAAKLASRAPKMQVQLVDLVPDDDIAQLKSHQVDLSLHPKGPTPDWVEAQTMFHSQYSVVARQDHPAIRAAGIPQGHVLPLDLLCALGHVGFSTAGNWRIMGDRALEEVGRSRHLVMTLPSMNSVLSAVRQSDLIALVPHQFAAHKRDSHGLSLFASPIPLPEVEICAYWHKSASNTPAHRWLRKVVASILATL